MTETIDLETEIAALRSDAFVDAWLDEPGVIMVPRSVVLLDTDPHVQRVTEFMGRHGYVLTETFPADDYPEFIAGRAVGQCWEIGR